MRSSYWSADVGSSDRAVVEDEVAEPGGAFLARPVVGLVEEAARPAGGTRGRNAAHHGTVLDVAGKHAEAGAAEHLGHVREDDRVAQVRLVGAVFQHRRTIGDRKSVGSGKRVSVRVDLGGGRTNKKK